MSDYKDIFKAYGQHSVVVIKHHHMSTDEASFTLEEFAAAIEARILDKLKQIEKDNWGGQLEGVCNANKNEP